jgi:hypothetical protein
MTASFQSNKIASQVPERQGDCSNKVMNDDRKKRPTEDQVEKIEAIRGSEVLGYEGAGREEHSGENSPKAPKSLSDSLADNRPEDVK